MSYLLKYMKYSNSLRQFKCMLFIYFLSMTSNELSKAVSAEPTMLPRQIAAHTQHKVLSIDIQ